MKYLIIMFLVFGCSGEKRDKYKYYTNSRNCLVLKNYNRNAYHNLICRYNVFLQNKESVEFCTFEGHFNSSAFSCGLYDKIKEFGIRK